MNSLDDPCHPQFYSEMWPLLKSSEEVTLTVATTSQLPTSVVVAQTYSWVTPDGRPTSPPPEYNPRLHHHQVQRVEVEVMGSESLGLMIRGGVEYGLGIFITGVDSDSAAHKAGLQVGDQILEVNSESFLAVTHDTAVNILKYSRRLRLAIRRVSKLPHSCTTYDRRCWPAPTQSNGEISAENMEATLAMIEEKSQRVLTRQSHERLREVVGDYAAGRIPIEHLLIIARDILDSPDKMSLLTELREVVRVEDQDQFDAAVFRHDPLPQEKTDAYVGQVSNLDDFIDMYNQLEMHQDALTLVDEDDRDGVDVEEEEDDDVLRGDQRVAEVGLGLREIAKTPSEDSGVEMSNGAMIHRRDVARSLSERKRTSILMRENEASIDGVTWADVEMDEDEFQMKREMEERHAIGSKREKLLLKRYSERILPKDEDIHNLKRRHSHTGEPNGAGGGGMNKSHHASLTTSAHHAHGQRSALSHARKQYESYDKTTTTLIRGLEDYNLPSTCVRDDYHHDPPPPSPPPPPPPPPSSSSRGARVEDYHDHSNAAVAAAGGGGTRVVRGDEYDPSSSSVSSSRVRGGGGGAGAGGESSAARIRDEYDPLSSSPSSRGVVVASSEYEHHLSSLHVHDEYLQDSGCGLDGYDELHHHHHHSVVDDAYDLSALAKGHVGDYGLPPPPPSHQPPNSNRDVYDGSPSRNHLTVDHRTGCNSGSGNSPSSPGGGTREGNNLLSAVALTGRRGSSEKQEDTHPPYACRSRRTSLVVSDSQGRFRVVVKKTRPNLGIAIEGGADTKQWLPRVINIAANGAAFEAGGLRVGQLIIAVDGQKLDGHSHEEAARLIASCWVSRSRPEVEFMVVERKQTAADVRRSSISLLSQM